MTSERMRKTTNGAPSLDRKDRFKSWSAITGASYSPPKLIGCRGRLRSRTTRVGGGIRTGIVSLYFETHLLDSSGSGFIQDKHDRLVSGILVCTNENPNI